LVGISCIEIVVNDETTELIGHAGKDDIHEESIVVIVDDVETTY
jgi:hypothetical protein